MSLDSDWFAGTGATDYLDVKAEYDFSGAGSSTSTSGGYTVTTIKPCGSICFLWDKAAIQPSAVHDHLQNRMDPEYGYMWAVRDSDSAIHPIPWAWFNQIFLPGSGQNKRIASRWAKNYGAGAAYQSAIKVATQTGATDTCSLHIYQPWCFYGRVGQVMASILLHMGLDDGQFDQTAWSDADDGQAAIGSDEWDEPWVFYRREIGQTVAETVKSLARHSWDLLCVNMAGKLALMSRNNIGAGYTISGLDSTDGVVSVSWRIGYEHMANYAITCTGRWFQSEWQYVTGPGYLPVTCEETSGARELQEHGGTGFPFGVYSDSTAITKHGQIDLGDSQTTVMKDGEPQDVRYYNLQYFSYLDETPQATADDWADATLFHMARLSTHESQTRRVVTVVQDFQGLDYDIGYSVEDVELTADGDTIGDMRCIAKTIDFRTMQVESTLLEEL